MEPDISVSYGGHFLARLPISSEKGVNVWKEDRHCNAGYEVHYCLRGQADFICDCIHYRMQRGDVVFVAPGIFHSSEAKGQDLLHFAVTLSQTDHKAGVMLRSLIGTNSSLKMSRRLLELTEVLAGEICGEANETMLNSLVTTVLIMTFRELGVQETSAEPKRVDNRFSRTDIIDRFFEEHFNEYGMEERLASTLGLSTRQLKRVLLEEYGETYRDKLLSLRIDKAAFLLRNTDLSVAEICADVGYSSETSLFKQFKKKYNQTPAEYRKYSENWSLEEKGR